MSNSSNSPGLILGGGAAGGGNSEDDPNELAQTYQNLLSGAADLVSGLHGKVLDLQAGAIQTASFTQTTSGYASATPQEVETDRSILAEIAAYCTANNIGVQVDADLTDTSSAYGAGTNALVDNWANAAAAVGLPIVSVEDVQEIGATESPTTFATYASNEVLSIQSLIQCYATSSYTLTASNLAAGDMEGTPYLNGVSSSNMTTISEWWQTYDTAAKHAGLSGFSYVTADTGWDAPWIPSLATPNWQAYLESLSRLASSGNMSLNVDMQGVGTDTSSNQFIQQIEEDTASLANLEKLGLVDVGNLEFETWGQLPNGVSQISSPTSMTNAAAEAEATYSLYAAGLINADGSITTGSPGQIIVATGAHESIKPLSIHWDSADVQQGHQLAVVIIDQTGTLTAAQHGFGTVDQLAPNILALAGNSADLAAELGSVILTELNSGPDTIDIETFGSAGRVSDSQISALALQPGQNPDLINSSSNLQGWTTSSAFLNGGSVISSETMYWNTTGTLAGTISSTTPSNQSAFVKLDAVHEPLAEYGVQSSVTVGGTTLEKIADVNNPNIDNWIGIANQGGAANNNGQDIAVGLSSWLPGVFDPAQVTTQLTVQSTTESFDPVSGELETSVDTLAPDLQTVLTLSGTLVANAFATQFNSGGSQVVQYNTGNNPAWQAGWGNQFSSATLTYDSAGQLVEEFLQGGSSDPSFTIDDIFDPNNGELWEEFQSAAPPPTASYSNPVTNFVTGPLYITEFNTGDNPNWDYLDWGTASASDTEVWTDYFVIQNMSGLFVSNDVDSYNYEFANGSTLDLLNLPGTINVDLNNLSSVVIGSQLLSSGLSGLTAIDAAGATGTVTLTGATAGGSTLIGGDSTSTITGYGHDTIVLGNGINTINTGSGGSTVLMSGKAGTATIGGDNNKVTVGTVGNGVFVTGNGDTITAVAGVEVTDSAASTSLTVNGNGVTITAALGDTIIVIGTADIINFVGGENPVAVGASSSAVLTNVSSIAESLNVASGTVKEVGNNDAVTMDSGIIDTFGDAIDFPGISFTSFAGEQISSGNLVLSDTSGPFATFELQGAVALLGVDDFVVSQDGSGGTILRIGSGSAIAETMNYTNGTSVLYTFNPMSGVAETVATYGGINATGSVISDIVDNTAGSSMLYLYNPSSSVSETVTTYGTTNATGTVISAIVDNSAGSSVLYLYNPSSSVSETVTTYGTTNATGTVISAIVDNSAGSSVLYLYNPSGSVSETVTTYGTANATGTVVSAIVDNTNNKSVLYLYNPSSSVSETVTTYSATNATGTVVSAIVDNTNATSVLYLYNPNSNVRETVTTYSATNATGTVVSAIVDNTNGTSVRYLYNPTSNVTETATFYSGTNATGTVTSVTADYTNNESAITTYSSGNPSSTIYYSEPNGAGSIILGPVPGLFSPTPRTPSESGSSIAPATGSVGETDTVVPGTVSPDSSVIQITGSDQLIDPGTGSHTIQFASGATADALMLHLGASDQVLGFNPAAGDILDLGALLSEARVNIGNDISQLGSYVSVVDIDGSAQLSFDPTGHGGGTEVAMLVNVGDQVAQLPAGKLFEV